MNNQERVSKFSQNLQREARQPHQAEKPTDESSLALSFLQPIAAPSVLGLYALATATFMVGAYFAGWYGGPNALSYVFPFAATFGGLTQLAVAMWAFKARDVVATATHGTWGSYWLGFGILNLLFATGALSMPKSQFVPLGFWFIPLTVITLLIALVTTTQENLAMALVTHMLWTAAGCLAIGFLFGVVGWQAVGGYLLVLSSLCAVYTATALMFETMGRTVLPIGNTGRAKEKPQFDTGAGEPGIQQGQ